MFSKLFIAVVATLATFAVAIPTSGNDINNSCNGGTVQCCNDSYDAGSFEGKFLEHIFHLDVPANTKIGLTCSPLTALGVGSGSSCSQQPVCCTGNDMEGLIVLGCSPVNVNV